MFLSSRRIECMSHDLERSIYKFDLVAQHMMCPDETNTFAPTKNKNRKMDEIWRNLESSGISLDFDRFLGQKGVKCYPIWILRPDLESSRHVASIRPFCVKIFKFCFFHGKFKMSNGAGTQFFWKKIIFFFIFEIGGQKCIRNRPDINLFLKRCKTGHPAI